MELFWTNGYEATSLASLIEQMGIGRQSLYNTFGDKHSLFIEATKHYIDRNGQHLLDAFQASGSPLESVRKAMGQVVDLLTCGECRGCLVTNAIVELAPHDVEVRELVHAMMNRVEKTIKSTLDRAVEEGELSASCDTRAIARLLNCTVNGLAVMHKASASRAALKDVVRIALTTLR